VSFEEVEQVKNALRSVGEAKAMRPIYEYLGENISYDKIRLAMAVLEKSES